MFQVPTNETIGKGLLLCSLLESYSSITLFESKIIFMAVVVLDNVLFYKYRHLPKRHFHTSRNKNLHLKKKTFKHDSGNMASYETYALKGKLFENSRETGEIF